MSIERIIHQVWLDLGKGAEIPKEYDEMRNTWRENHPEWKIILWGNFDKASSVAS